MSQNKEKRIVIESEVSVKKSPKLKQVAYKSKAGLSEEEAIERHTIGEYNRERTPKEGEQEEG